VREQERALRAEQDRAYEEAGRRDREKVLAKKREEDERRRKEEEARRAQMEAEEKVRVKRAWRAWMAKNLPPEPEKAVKGATTRVVVRLPDGRRIMRTFDAKERTETLYAFVEVEAGEKEDGPLPDGYVHQFDFVLATSFPRRIVDKTGGKTLDQVDGLVPSANLVVEGWKNGDDESDEEDEESE
jgi:FAS-associated factor 2